MQYANTGEFKPFDASKYSVGIVVAQFNKHITEESLQSALKVLDEYSVPKHKINVLRVAGSAEVPVALQALAKSKKYDCLLAIGTVIQGATPHFDYVCKIVTEGILRVELEYNIFQLVSGFLTCANEEQAKSRANLGGEHMIAALQLTKSTSEIN